MMKSELSSSFRYFHDTRKEHEDPITLSMIRDLPVVPKGITTSLHHLDQNDAWTRKDIDQMGTLLEDHGFNLNDCMIESIPWTDPMKVAGKGWEKECERISTIIRDLAERGFHHATYNIMGVADWTRTNLKDRLPNGELSLSFDRSDLKSQIGEDFRLPGWGRVANPVSRATAEKFWSPVNEEQMFTALEKCLKIIIPVCAENNFKLSLHPDDPPYRVLDWVPRIVTNYAALKRIIEMVDSPYNGLCFCTGSLGVLPENDLPKMVELLAHRIHFLHLRPLKVAQGGNFFIEVPHGEGDTPLKEVIHSALKSGIAAQYRPDHAPSLNGAGLIFRPGESEGRAWRPGYDYLGRGRGLKWIDSTIKDILFEEKLEEERLKLNKSGNWPAKFF